jgi:hypothetical protein
MWIKPLNRTSARLQRLSRDSIVWLRIASLKCTKNSWQERFECVVNFILRVLAECMFGQDF